jgi:hypothetical protein
MAGIAVLLDPRFRGDDIKAGMTSEAGVTSEHVASVAGYTNSNNRVMNNARELA